MGNQMHIAKPQAVKSICDYYGVELKTIRLGFRLRRDYEFLGRNTIFVIVAASLGPALFRISIGINRGPEYYDITQTFVSDCQKVLDGYFGGTVIIEAPFVNYSKREIIDFSRRRRVPLNLTFSCQEKNEPPCGKCPSCMDRKKYGVF
jgi:7-cyano-7-deazaguanine synthase